MATQYATGKRALAICDRCGFSIKYQDLRVQVIDARPVKLLVCASCLDQDHPQLQLGKVPVNDPQALRDARPDINRDVGLFGWQPVGNAAQCLTGAVGQVSIQIGG